MLSFSGGQEPFHVHVAFRAPLCPRDVPQSRRHQHQGALPVRERSDDARASSGPTFDDRVKDRAALAGLSVADEE